MAETEYEDILGPGPGADTGPGPSAFAEDDPLAE
jgi:hypothetical protein